MQTSRQPRQTVLNRLFSLTLAGLVVQYIWQRRRERGLLLLAQERASQLQVTLDSMADIVLVLDARGNIVDANAPAINMLGARNRADALRPLADYEQCLRMLRLDGRALTAEDYSIALQGETFRGFLRRLPDFGEPEAVYELTASPIKSVRGDVLGTVLLLRDVTQLAWGAARDTIARFATGVARALSLDDLVREVLQEASAALDADMVTLYRVAESKQLVLIGERNMPQAMADELGRMEPWAASLSARACATGKLQVIEDLAEAPVDLAIPVRLGSQFGFGSLVSVPLGVRGQTIGVMTYAIREARHFTQLALDTIGAIGDIIAVGLENARLYDEAQFQRGRLMAVIESSPEAIMFFEAPSGRIVLANKASAKLAGLPLELDSTISDHPLLHGLCRPNGTPYETENLPVRRAMRGEVLLGEEMAICQPSGTQIPILISAAPIRGAAGRVMGALAIFQDVSRTKDLERQREEFLSIIAHDLRAPLTVIYGHAQLLRQLADRHLAPPQEMKGLEIILNSSRRLNAMVADLLDASRIEARRLVLKKEAIQLPELVERLVESLNQVTAEHPVRIDVSGDVPAVSADPMRVEQILTNLLTNAAKFSPAESEIIVNIAPAGGEAVLSVTDRGPGITPEEQARLFQRFYRTQEARGTKEGLGLGLYIAKGLVEAHGGKISVVSSPVEGTTFSVTLPTAMKQRAAEG